MQNPGYFSLGILLKKWVNATINEKQDNLHILAGNAYDVPYINLYELTSPESPTWIISHIMWSQTMTSLFMTSQSLHLKMLPCLVSTREWKISILAYAHKSSAKIMRSKCSDTFVNSVVKRLFFCLETMFWSVLSVHEDRVYPDLLLAQTMFWSAGFDQRAKELELSRPLHALCKQFVTLDSRRLGSLLIIVWYLKWGQN